MSLSCLTRLKESTDRLANYSRLTIREFSRLCVTMGINACYFACVYYSAYNKGKILLVTTEQRVKSTHSCRHKQLHYHTCHNSLRRESNTLQFDELLWQCNNKALCLADSAEPFPLPRAGFAVGGTPGHWKCEGPYQQQQIYIMTMFFLFLIKTKNTN
jgi:hypothetical protein